MCIYNAHPQLLLVTQAPNIPGYESCVRAMQVARRDLREKEISTS